MRKQIITNYGSCINLTFSYPDTFDVSADVFSVYDSSGDILNGATFTTVDAQTVEMFVPAEMAEGLTVGNVNWFRVKRETPDGCFENLEPIWVLVR